MLPPSLGLALVAVRGVRSDKLDEALLECPGENDCPSVLRRPWSLLLLSESWEPPERDEASPLPRGLRVIFCGRKTLCLKGWSDERARPTEVAACSPELGELLVVRLLPRGSIPLAFNEGAPWPAC